MPTLEGEVSMSLFSPSSPFSPSSSGGLRSKIGRGGGCVDGTACEIGFLLPWMASESWKTIKREEN